MTKIDQLEAAYEAATPGEWESTRHATPDYAPQFGVYAEGDQSDLAIVKGEGNTTFITLAHNLMPTLLEAVEHLRNLVPVADAALSQELSDGAVGLSDDLLCLRNAKALLEKLE